MERRRRARLWGTTGGWRRDGDREERRGEEATEIRGEEVTERNLDLERRRRGEESGFGEEAERVN